MATCGSKTTLQPPTQALIGFGKQKIYWRCSGSLISSRFVIAPGHCAASRRQEMALYESVVNSYMAGSWSPWTAEAAQVEELYSYSAEYQRVASKVTDTLKVEIDRIEKIDNPFLWGCFLLKEAEYKTKLDHIERRELFHCTAPCNIESIITNNLDWRRASRVKFGEGVSFSPSASYANLQAGNKYMVNSRALILAKVLVGRVCPGNEYMIIPPEDYDTSTGNGGSVIVKFRDYEFYPQYVIYYETPSIIFTRYGRRYEKY